MFGMSIEDLMEGRDEICVATTGAEYVFNKSDEKGEILCFQRIGEKRLTATLQLHRSLQGLTVEYKDSETCILNQSYPPTEGLITVRVNSDSLLSMKCRRPVKVTYESKMIPEYAAVEKGNFLFIDQKGGIGAYPLGRETPRTSAKFAKEGWRISLFLRGGQELLTSIFPPRPFEWDKSFEERIVHHNSRVKPYPSNEQLEDFGKNGNVLVLHSGWMHGKYTRAGRKLETTYDVYADAPWASFRHEPRDEKAFRRVVKRTHELGMKILVYMAPDASTAEDEEFLCEVDRVVREYGLDGVYFDGVSQDVWQAYEIMRGTRKLLGDKLLYVHIPSPIIGECYGEGYYVYCPFIDTYADYILRAEHVMKFDWNYLRYTISGHNISNSIGYVCNYDYPPSFTETIIDQVLEANARLPYWTGWWTSGRHLSKERSPEEKTEEEMQKIMKEKYFPKLQALEEKRTK